MSAEVQNNAKLERKVCLELKCCQNDPWSRPSATTRSSYFQSSGGL